MRLVLMRADGLSLGVSTLIRPEGRMRLAVGSRLSPLAQVSTLIRPEGRMRPQSSRGLTSS